MICVWGGEWWSVRIQAALLASPQTSHGHVLSEPRHHGFHDAVLVPQKVLAGGHSMLMTDLEGSSPLPAFDRCWKWFSEISAIQEFDPDDTYGCSVIIHVSGHVVESTICCQRVHKREGFTFRGLGCRNHLDLRLQWRWNLISRSRWSGCCGRVHLVHVNVMATTPCMKFLSPLPVLRFRVSWSLHGVAARNPCVLASWDGS